MNVITLVSSVVNSAYVDLIKVNILKKRVKKVGTGCGRSLVFCYPS